MKPPQPGAVDGDIHVGRLGIDPRLADYGRNLEAPQASYLRQHFAARLLSTLARARKIRASSRRPPPPPAADIALDEHRRHLLLRQTLGEVAEFLTLRAHAQMRAVDVT